MEESKIDMMYKKRKKREQTTYISRAKLSQYIKKAFRHMTGWEEMSAAHREALDRWNFVFCSAEKRKRGMAKSATGCRYRD